MFSGIRKAFTAAKETTQWRALPIFLSLATVCGVGAAVSPKNAGAVFIGNGNGLVYDDVNDITWFSSDVAMTWSATKSWIDSLTVGDTTAGSWSFALTTDTTKTLDFVPDAPFSKIFTEFCNTPETAVISTGPFTTIADNIDQLRGDTPYWYGQQWDRVPGAAFVFYWEWPGGSYVGKQSALGSGSTAFGMAWHPGNVGGSCNNVPEPGTGALMVPGAFMLSAMSGAVRRRVRQVAQKIGFGHGSAS